MENKKIKRGAVISGGGAWGAYGVGLLSKLNKDYDVVAGISTGALMSPLVSLSKYNKLKEAYTSVSDKDIFDLKWYLPRPIKKNGKENIFAILLALIMGWKTFGTTKKLRKTIDKFFSYQEFEEIVNLEKDIIVGAQNLKQSPSRIHYFNIKDMEKNHKGYEDFKDWMWASANAPFGTSLIKKEWSDPLFPNKTYMGQWTDGGLTELAPFTEVANRNCDEIDVIVHRPLPTDVYEIDSVDNLIENVGVSVDAMRFDIEFEYLFINAKLIAEKGTKVTIYFLPRKLSNNSLVFNKNDMTEWVFEGYNNVDDDRYKITFEPIKE
jgi:predicted acylesterase/phospholipase RssA